ncbi:unnamed protein product, partial [Ectocarpus fasciculatus]
REAKGSAVAAGAAAAAGGTKSQSSGEPDPEEVVDEFDQMDAEEREEAFSGTSHTVSWRKARAYLCAVITARWRCGTKSRICRHRCSQEAVTPASISPAAAPAMNAVCPADSSGPEPSDIEAGRAAGEAGRRSAEPSPGEPAARDNDQGGMPSNDVKAGSRGQGFVPFNSWRRRRSSGAESGGGSDGATGRSVGRWCNLCRGGVAATVEEQQDNVDAGGGEGQQRQTPRKQRRQRRRKQRCQDNFLPVPMLGCGLVERLGAVTTLCMLDEDTVCEPTSAIKEVFLVDSKVNDAGVSTGTVLDMHTQQGKKGVRFEDPHWWTHLPALKPIGLTCLLAEKNPEQPRQQTKRRSVLSSPVLTEGPSSQSARSSQNQNPPCPALLDHVRDDQPMEHLADLSEAIGFCAADRGMFRERRRIHVINPKLAASRATEDTHAQGQDESRRRGTIQPHLTSVMAQERRSGALQLLSQGNPSIVLGMCRDYWDGSAISNLPAGLRKTILGMHQQWSLEDLDVVAFAYVPVPYTVNPFISSFNKHPDYLIHLSQSQASSSGKGRSSVSGGGGGSRAGASPAISPLPSSSPRFQGANSALGIISETSRTHQQDHNSNSIGGDDISSGATKGDDPNNSRGVEGLHSLSPPSQERGGTTEGGAQGFAGQSDRAGSPPTGAVGSEANSDGAGPSGGEEQPSSVTGAARQCSSANSSPISWQRVRSELRKAKEPGSESERCCSHGEYGELQGTKSGSSVVRVLTRGASDGCLDSSSSNRGNNKSNPASVRQIVMQPMESSTSVAAVCEVTAEAGLKQQQQQGVQGGSRRSSISSTSFRRRAFEAVPEGEAVNSGGGNGGVVSLGDDGLSDPAETELASAAKKEVTFLFLDDSTTKASAAGAKENEGEEEAGTAGGDSGGSGAKGGGLLRKKKLYSMDDYGVNIAHRAELHTSKVPVVPASGDKKMAEALWNLAHDQVFLGMAASFVPPKRDIVALIEDVEAAGVRFVYFSPRNMRRSKALAESMGIETDWNCAISLRPLEDSSQPDPHRMKSSYADWDVKARLPHGIADIRDHIESVDNVPLLVSLFTDATPETIKDMLAIYQENDECTLAVGMSHRAVNADLFRAADLSFSVESLPLNQPLASLPVASASRFSAIDSAFNSSIVGLHTALPLGDVMRRGGAIVGLDDVGSIIIDLIREGRCLLTNTYQALSFLLLGSFAVALLVLVAAAVPISEPMVLGGGHLIWSLWLVAPLLATSFLASPSDGSLMKRTPEKNDPKASDAHADWVDIVWCLAQDNARGEKAREASEQAVDLVILELVLCLIAQSASFMYRQASIRKEPPWKNWVWNNCVIFILCLQVFHLWAAGAARGSLQLLFKSRWEPLVAGLFCPFAVLGIAELLKRSDARVFDRYVTLLRLEFDTRLGMHSPR